MGHYYIKQLTIGSNSLHTIFSIKKSSSHLKNSEVILEHIFLLCNSFPNKIKRHTKTYQILTS
jgi:hypothetical protein